MAARRRGAPAGAPSDDLSTTTTTIQPTAGQEDRDEGAAVALDAAWPIWRLAAKEHLDVLAASAREFTADDLLDGVGLPPVTGSPNAIGALFVAASRRGDIRQVGWSTSTRRSRHAGVQRVWMGVES